MHGQHDADQVIDRVAKPGISQPVPAPPAIRNGHYQSATAKACQVIGQALARDIFGLLAVNDILARSMEELT